jgi:putative endonuclease
MQKQYYTYILASQKNGTLYVGVTSDLIKRVWQHKNKAADGFTAQHNVTILVYYEIFDSIEEAIKREKRMKKLYRKEKLALIEAMNPDWNDLYNEIIK